MQTSKRLVFFLCSALAFCFGSLALADDFHPLHSLSMVVATVGNYGDAYAKYHAEQSYMQALPERMCSSTASLVKDSHGYLQASASEVTKGTIGASGKTTNLV